VYEQVIFIPKYLNLDFDIQKGKSVSVIWSQFFFIFLSKYIFKGAVDMKFSPDVGNNPSNPYLQRKQNK